MDFSLSRTFEFSERRSAEFRWETFNHFNTPQFGQPNGNASSGSFGVISSLAGDPRVMQFALRVNFQACILSGVRTPVCTPFSRRNSMTLLRSRCLVPFLLVILAVAAGAAQPVASATWRAAAPGEATLSFRASTPGTNWGEPGHEAAVLDLFLDGKLRQNVVLFAGATPFVYHAALGHLDAGSHRVDLVLDAQQSAPAALRVLVAAMHTAMVTAGDHRYLALEHAPLLYARPDTIGKFSDLPLLMWDETSQQGDLTTMQYSVIFTDEDGGTEINARAARWGRDSDIEWIYRVTLDGQDHVIAETFQGPSHHTQHFQGKHEGQHPVLIDATDNNNVDDHGSTPILLGLATMPYDLRHESREEIMDEHPWTYRIMDEEVVRQGKTTDGNALIPGKAADPHRYLYIDAIAHPQGAAVSFDVKFRGNPVWATSDFGIGYFRIDRSGYFRTTVRLPEGTDASQIEQLAVRCDLAFAPNKAADAQRITQATCGETRLDKVFVLDQNDRPHLVLPQHPSAVDLKLGELIDLYPGGVRKGAGKRHK